MPKPLVTKMFRLTQEQVQWLAKESAKRDEHEAAIIRELIAEAMKRKKR